MKTRTEGRTRIIPKVIDGIAHNVTQKYSEEVPVMPRDLDSFALNKVVGAVSLIVAAAVVWSTVSIGALLSMVAPAWAAYLIAAVFDLAWITCMVLEWLSRYDQTRATLPRRCGWAALVLSMAMISLHGTYSGHWQVGLAGACVSVVAKGLWMILMRHMSVEMDPETLQWVTKEKAAMNGQLALMTMRRQLERSKARLAEEVAALSYEQNQAPVLSAVQDVRPVSESSDGRTDTDMSVRDDVRPSVRPVSVPARQAVSGKASASGRAKELVSEGLSDDMVREVLALEYPEVKRDSLYKAVRRARPPYA